MEKQRVSLLITDLDNTLYDWLDIWYRSFRPMLEKLVELSGIPRDQLVSEIKAIHQRHRTSEYAFLIEEIPSLQAKHPNEDLTKIYEEAIQQYRRGRAESLKLYPGVLETLKFVRGQGTLVVGYTESMAFYTNYRIRHLGLDCLLDYVYSPEDHDIPANLDTEKLRLYPASNYDFVHAEHRYTPRGELKPNPAVLKKILTDLRVSPSNCIYVGDSLMKDVSMANDVGVMSVHAKYGESHNRSQYELLKDVTHWSDADVEREKSFKPGTAACSLTGSFGELINVVGFVERGRGEMEQIENQLKVWEKIVDVQMHFNELSVKIRGLAITVLGAILTAGAFSLKEHLAITVFSWVIPAATPILLIALLTWSAFYLMDHLWYHRLLKGAVEQGLAIEKLLEPTIPGIGLAGTIGRASALYLQIGSGDRYNLHTDNRLRAFYGLGAFILVVLMALSLAIDVTAPQAVAKPPDARKASAQSADRTSADPSAPDKKSMTVQDLKIGMGSKSLGNKESVLNNTVQNPADLNLKVPPNDKASRP